MKNRATISQKHTIDSQKPKREHKLKKKEILKPQKGKEEKKKEERRNNQQENKVWDGNKNILSLITLNANWLNAPIKRHTVAEWIKKLKNKSLQYAAYKRTNWGQRTHRLKVRGWKKIFQENGNDKKVGVATHI